MSQTPLDRRMGSQREEQAGAEEGGAGEEDVCIDEWDLNTSRATSVEFSHLVSSVWVG